ncbi:unnamed protein product [Withania somnifera]
MVEDGAVTIYSGSAITDTKKNTFSIKVGAAQMLRGGAIAEVKTVNQKKIAESAGACCIVVSEPKGPGISRMADPSLIMEIKQAVTIPVMAKAPIGVDYIDESEFLALADEDYFFIKHNFRAPFVFGCRELGEALRRAREGVAMVRTQGDLLGFYNMEDDEVFTSSKKIGAPYDIVAQTKQMGRLPAVHFAAGGIVTPADNDAFGLAIVQAVRDYNDPHILAAASSGLEEAMGGLNQNENRVERFVSVETY